ncbi:MAG: GNAT family N-acetyltransferase [Sulfitobacter sp.]
MTAPVQIAPATSLADLDAVRDLCWAYRDFLSAHAPVEAEITRIFYPPEKYAQVMTALPDLHARPRGIILLARIDGAPVGCGMSHGLDAARAEIKRLFVTPAARGRSVARQLCTALLDQARSDGYARVLLDTSSGLLAAQNLYARLGFTPRGPYQPVPGDMLPHLRFYEYKL